MADWASFNRGNRLVSPPFQVLFDIAGFELVLKFRRSGMEWEIPQLLVLADCNDAYGSNCYGGTNADWWCESGGAANGYCWTVGGAQN